MQRHIVEQLADFAPMVQILDDPVPLMDQSVEVFRLLDIPVPEQVIAVPKISQDSIQQPVDRDTHHGCVSVLLPAVRRADR